MSQTHSWLVGFPSGLGSYAFFFTLGGVLRLICMMKSGTTPALYRGGRVPPPLKDSFFGGNECWGLCCCGFLFYSASICPTTLLGVFLPSDPLSPPLCFTNPELPKFPTTPPPCASASSTPPNVRWEPFGFLHFPPKKLM